MQVVYGFIFYFVSIMIGLTAALSIFSLQSTRKLLFKIKNSNNKIFSSQMLHYFVNFTFALIGLILMQSIWTFSQVNSHLKEHHQIDNMNWQLIDYTKTNTRESDLQVFHEYKEYYLAQRNILLTCSALFVYYVFHRLLFNINKLADIQNGVMTEENKIEDESNKQKIN